MPADIVGHLAAKVTADGAPNWVICMPPHIDLPAAHGPDLPMSGNHRESLLKRCEVKRFCGVMRVAPRVYSAMRIAERR
jgi:hypothetical protein